VYRIIGYAPEARWSSYQGAVEASLQTFERLTDPAALNIQPQRVEVVTVDRRTTIADLAQARRSPVSASTLALINQVELDTPLEPGRLVKVIVGR
jgi:predicted Zn-dependent protease